jgi:hypothetical protein
MLISASDNSLLIYSSALIWFFKKESKEIHVFMERV